jgi:two-component system, chemotaxis family, protein-glutamate methylesterase/glutaminase
MRKIRVLIVDDSVVIRKLLTDILSADPAVEVVGTAANGRIALSKLSQVNPDLVTLDVEMPELNGLETLAALRKTYPKLPVIMFSTLTARGASATLDALALGANDYVTKPANVGSVAAGMQRIRDDLIPKIKAFCGRIAGIEQIPLPPRVQSARTAIQQSAIRNPQSAIRVVGRRVDVVTIGVSTGGPNALATLLSRIPASFPVPIVLVQHMPPTFTRLLAERLAAKSAIRVGEGAPGSLLSPGQTWIAPGDFHMIVERDGTAVRLRMQQGPPENSCRPAVDVLFRSVAETFGAHTLAVVLTGMGQDGLRGCEAIHEVGGQVIVQDEATSVVWGMPGFVARAGLADKVLPLEELPLEILRRVNEGHPAMVGNPSPGTPLQQRVGRS